eukprot:gene4011-4262_t
MGTLAAGMVPDDNLILLNSNKKDDCVGKLARLIGHEMVHVIDRRAWGGEGFGCRYVSSMFDILGTTNINHWSTDMFFDARNAVEKGAYEKEQYIETNLIPGCGTSAVDDVDTIVTKAFCRVLRRGVDDSGKVTWRNYMLAGHTVKELMVQLVSSAEYYNRFVHDKTCTEVVTTLYDALLDREPDPTGMNTWCPVLYSSGLSDVIRGIVDSVEYGSLAGPDKVPDRGNRHCP